MLTPKAQLEPVRLAGTTVTFATLHNQDYITQKDIRIGDTVVVQKAGEIIPEIVEVVTQHRPAGAAPYYLPQTCPVCGAPVERARTARLCAAPARNARLSACGISPISPAGTPWILTVWPAVLNQLIESGLVKTAADLYDLTAADIAPLERMGEKSAANAVAAIYKSRDNDLWRLIFALGIRQVGEKAAKVPTAVSAPCRPVPGHGGGTDLHRRCGPSPPPISASGWKAPNPGIPAAASGGRRGQYEL